MHGLLSGAAEMQKLVASIESRYPDTDVVAIKGFEYEFTLQSVSLTNLQSEASS